LPDYHDAIPIQRRIHREKESFIVRNCNIVGVDRDTYDFDGRWQPGTSDWLIHLTWEIKLLRAGQMTGYRSDGTFQ
jgi:hypothetical protein